jgi:hypothetical protein
MKTPRMQGYIEQYNVFYGCKAGRPIFYNCY